jgi:hypothetical protein
MANLQQQLEKMAHDVTSGPGLFDSIEIAVVGGAVGAAIGYAKDRDFSGAKSFGLWGAGLGIAGQYLLFHMLKPATKTFARTAHAAAQASPQLSLQGVHPGLGHPAQRASASGGYYTGAVKGIGGFRGGQMPFGPGRWPTGFDAAPDSNQEVPNPGRLDPYFGGQVDELHYDPGLSELGSPDLAFMGDSEHYMESGPLGPVAGAYGVTGETTAWGDIGAAPYGRGYFERGEIQPGQRRRAWWEW